MQEEERSQAMQMQDLHLKEEEAYIVSFQERHSLGCPMKQSATSYSIYFFLLHTNDGWDPTNFRLPCIFSV